MTSNNNSFLYLGAALYTGIAGILHLILVTGSINYGIEFVTFFLVSGIAQLFWVLPMIKKWGRIWYAIGIAGTAILAGLTGYAIANIFGDPQPTPLVIAELAVAIEIFQVSYIVFTGIIIARKE